MELKEVAGITQIQMKEMRKLQRNTKRKTLVGLQQEQKGCWQRKHRRIRHKLLSERNRGCFEEYGKVGKGLG